MPPGPSASRSSAGSRCLSPGLPKPSAGSQTAGSRCAGAAEGWREPGTTAKKRAFPRPGGESAGRPPGCSLPPTGRRARHGATKPSDFTPMNTGSRSSSPPPSPIWPTGPTAATSSPARLTSPTAGTRSPPRPPPAPSATTSPSMRRRAAGISTRHGPSPVTRSRRPPGDLRTDPVLAVDLNHGHLACCVVDPSGNPIAEPATVPIELAGIAGQHARRAPSEGHQRTDRTAREHGCRAIVIEDLDFAANREEGRERQGNRPDRAEGAARPSAAPSPASRPRSSGTGSSRWPPTRACRVIVVDPAYTC